MATFFGIAHDGQSRWYIYRWDETQWDGGYGLGVALGRLRLWVRLGRWT